MVKPSLQIHWILSKLKLALGGGGCVGGQGQRSSQQLQPCFFCCILKIYNWPFKCPSLEISILRSLLSSLFWGLSWALSLELSLLSSLLSTSSSDPSSVPLNYPLECPFILLSSHSLSLEFSLLSSLLSSLSWAPALVLSTSRINKGVTNVTQM